MSQENTRRAEPSPANGAHEAHAAPDAFDQVLAQFAQIIGAVEAKNAKAEELAKVPDDVPRFVTEYRS